MGPSGSQGSHFSQWMPVAWRRGLEWAGLQSGQVSLRRCSSPGSPPPEGDLQSSLSEKRNFHLAKLSAAVRMNSLQAPAAPSLNVTHFQRCPQLYRSAVLNPGGRENPLGVLQKTIMPEPHPSPGGNNLWGWPQRPGLGTTVQDKAQALPPSGPHPTLM